MPQKTDVSDQSDLSNLILEADEQTWQRIKKALGVETRQEAIRKVEADVKARQAVIAAANAANAAFEAAHPAPESSLLTQTPEEDLLTRKKKKTELAGLMYGKSSGVQW